MAAGAETPTGALFASDGFETLYSHLYQANLDIDYNRENLTTSLVWQYHNGRNDVDATRTIVEGVIDELSGLRGEELDVAVRDEYLNETSEEWMRKLVTAKDQHRRASGNLIALGGRYGLDQFAAYALGHHVSMELPRGKSKLQQDVTRTEQNLIGADAAIRANVGKLLIHHTPTTIKAGIVKDEPIKIRGKTTRLPVYIYGIFGMQFGSGLDSVNLHHDIRIPTHRLDAASGFIESTADLLDVNNWWMREGLALGHLAVGPPKIDTPSQLATEEILYEFGKVQTVSMQALADTRFWRASAA